MRNDFLFFIDAMGGGGAERVISVLAPELSKRGYRVGIVMMRKKEIAYALPENVELYYLDDIPLTFYGKLIRRIFRFWNRYKTKNGLEKETPFYFYARYAIQARSILKQHKGCTAFGFLIRSSVVLALAARGQNVTTVYCERSNPYRFNIDRNLITLRDRYYPKYDKGVFLTEEIMSYYKALKGEKRVILNPVVSGIAEPFTGERRHDIVTFCRLGPEKRLDILIDAFEQFKAEHGDYTLHIYGEGSEKERLENYIAEKKLEHSVFMEPFAKDIHKKIVDCAMYVSTSDYEGLSNSMLEALALGLPSICTDCDGGGARMMIQDHVNGVLIPKGDSHALSTAMKEIAESPELSQILSRNAAKVKDRLKVSSIADQWIDLAKA